MRFQGRVLLAGLGLEVMRKVSGFGCWQVLGLRGSKVLALESTDSFATMSRSTVGPAVWSP